MHEEKEVKNKNANEKKVVFCTIYKGLTITMVPMGKKDAHGNIIPPKYCVFKPSKYGCSYETSNAEEIEKLKQNDLFKEGKIFIIDVDKQSVSDNINVTPVIKGGVNSNALNLNKSK